MSKHPCSDCWRIVIEPPCKDFVNMKWGDHAAPIFAACDKCKHVKDCHVRHGKPTP